jgi:hypothetical protein
MKPTCYEMYRSLTDCQLVDLILSGDTNASFYLISVKYQQELYKVIFKYLKRFHTKLLDDSELEYWLYKFQDDIDTLTKITKKHKLGQINNRHNIKTWLCQCCKHFLLKWKKIDTNCDIDLETIVDDYSTDSESEVQYRDMLKQKAMEYLFFSLSNRDTYIIVTYLYCIEKGFASVHCDEKIANVLSEHGCPHMTAEYVRKIKNKSLNNANKKFKKHETNKKNGDIFLLVVETNDDFLTERREIIMKTLGIERDFITDIDNSKKT